MAVGQTQSDTPPIVQRKLAQVRRGVRAYVWLEGLALLVAAAAAAFWVGLLLDWSFEPSPDMRLAALIGVGLLGLWIAYRFLLRRAFTDLPDASLAVLLERRFDQLKDHLLTAVDLADGDATHYHPALVTRTQQAAATAITGVNPRQLFRSGPLVARVVIAVALAASIGIFALAAQDAFGFWVKRLALGTDLWPRRVHLEVVGFPPDADGRRAQKIARDDAFELVVRASTENYVVPEHVEFRFESADGGRGRDTMIRVGEAVPGRDDAQLFRYEFKDVTSSMTFDVIGGDDRVEDLHLQIVDRPELVDMEVECVYPKYLNRPPRRLAITGGMRIPEGTHLTLHAKSTKPLTDVRAHSSAVPQPVSLLDAPQAVSDIRWEYGMLATDDVVALQVTDIDGVASREPYRVSLSVIRDEPPQIAVRLAGVGSAVTPDAVVPLAGKVTDDYGLEQIWCEYRVNDGPTRRRPMLAQPDGNQEATELDTFDTRGPDVPGGERAVELEPGQTLFLSVRASDRYDIADAPHVGASPQYALDVVTPAQLLAVLERRELELRQRFEAVFAKMTDTRNLLARVDFSDSDSESDSPSSNSPDSAAERALSRRRLRVAGALQNVTQSSHEVLGLAEAFDDIYGQLENNRIDNVDLKSRIREQIARPLRQLNESSMTDLESQLQLVAEHVDDATTGASALADAGRMSDAVLVEMQQILDRMLELESYNEVVALLRGIVEDQEKLNERTKRQQTSRLEDLLED